MTNEYFKSKYYIVGWLKNYLNKFNKNAVIGISGGVDSAVCAALCCEAIGSDRVYGYYIPAGTISLYCNIENGMPVGNYFVDNSPPDIKALVEKFKFKYSILTLGNIIQQFTSVPRGDKLRQGNLAARLRMITLYDQSVERNALVIDTTNACEAWTGYFTKWGDGAGDIGPIVHLMKSEVKSLAKELGVPKSIIDKIPTAGLWDGQTDEGDLGATYEQIEDTMTNFFPMKTPEKIYSKLRELHKSTRHKTHVISVMENE